jgi:hypothetical protein
MINAFGIHNKSNSFCPCKSKAKDFPASGTQAGILMSENSNSG